MRFLFTASTAIASGQYVRQKCDATSTIFNSNPRFTRAGMAMMVFFFSPSFVAWPPAELVDRVNGVALAGDALDDAIADRGAASRYPTVR